MLSIFVGLSILFAMFIGISYCINTLTLLLISTVLHDKHYCKGTKLVPACKKRLYVFTLRHYINPIHWMLTICSDKHQEMYQYRYQKISSWNKRYYCDECHEKHGAAEIMEKLIEM